MNNYFYNNRFIPSVNFFFFFKVREIIKNIMYNIIYVNKKAIT